MGPSTRFSLLWLALGVAILGIAGLLAVRESSTEQEHVRQRAQRGLVERADRALLEAAHDEMARALRGEPGGSAWFFPDGSVPPRPVPGAAGYEDAVHGGQRWDAYRGRGEERYPTVVLRGGELVYDVDALAATAETGVPVSLTVGEPGPSMFLLSGSSGALGRSIWAEPWEAVAESRGRPWWSVAVAGLLVGLLIEVAVLVHRRTATRERQELLQRLSHDLRTPAATIRSMAGTLRVVEAEERSQFLDLIDDEAERLSVGLERMLRAARGEGEVGVEPVPLSLEDWLAALQTRWSGRLPGLEVQMDGPHTATLDPDRLDEAVDALLDNARRYGGPGVVVSVEGDERALRVVVEDDGPGVPPADRERVLQRHQSGRGGGFGLGLWAADQVARAHGGRLDLAGGSRFVLHLRSRGS